jgi:hypothetical protein
VTIERPALGASAAPNASPPSRSSADEVSRT